MSAMKFKVGDAVRRFKNFPWDHEYDKTFYVEKVGFCLINIKGLDGEWDPDYFYSAPPEKEPPSPYIEEVPAIRRLKPGWYGYVEITKSNTVGMPAYLSADVGNISELREAIATLSGIADFLEEKK